MNLPNKVAVVTGAAGIVGPDICRSLKARGWKVAATDRLNCDFDLAETAEGHGQYYDFRWIGDLATQSACRAFIQEVEQALGPVGLLVNNAATVYRETNLQALDEQRAINLFQINVLAPLWLVAAVEPSLKENRGVVLNISSAQTQGWLPDNHLYVASKAALEKLTETLSGSLAPHGIRTVGLRLGSFPGSHFLRDFLRQLPEAAARQMVEDILPQHFQNLQSALGSGHVGTARELAETIAFLTSDAARMFQGCTLDFDGGYTRQPQPWPGSANTRELAERWFADWQSARHSC